MNLTKLHGCIVGIFCNIVHMLFFFCESYYFFSVTCFILCLRSQCSFPITHLQKWSEQDPELKLKMKMKKTLHTHPTQQEPGDISLLHCLILSTFLLAQQDSHTHTVSGVHLKSEKMLILEVSLVLLSYIIRLAAKSLLFFYPPLVLPLSFELSFFFCTFHFEH